MYEKEHLIKEILYELGLNFHYKGYSYLVYGLGLLLERRELLTCITKGLYSEIAIYYDVKAANVERNIRTAIHVVWEKNKEKPLFKEYCYCPSNGAFMDLLLYEVEKRAIRF